jgi:cell division transport system permease protein
MGLTAVRNRTRAWARRHSYSFFSSLGALFQHRIGTLMTVLVLSIAILLPLGLYVMLSNFDRLELNQDQWGAITVFIEPDASEEAIRALAEETREQAGVAGVEAVSPEQGMAEFRESSGFGAAIELLEENPLPWVLLVNPAVLGEAGALLEARIGALMQWLQAHPLVDSVQYDHKWLQRLSRLLELGRAAVTVLSLLFGLAVIVVVANTIRLDVAARAEEIEILALVGAGNSFIRQPFLYSGLWYGLLGGLLALGLLQLCLFYLAGPLGRLLDAYGQEISLRGFDAPQLVLLLLGSGLLGLLGAWISVQRYLRMLVVGGSLGRK